LIARRIINETGFSTASLPFDRHSPQSHVSGLERQGDGLWNMAQILGQTLAQTLGQILGQTLGYGRSKRRLEEQIKHQTDRRQGKATTNFVAPLQCSTMKKIHPSTHYDMDQRVKRKRNALMNQREFPI
ncbi:MAG: hypothetical protein LBT62_00985, partial [Deltaproteobacteria bacterium]|jgi:hypothetical protein|nr:hypothetical protein [Deltaproteobacteria bacterium]